MKIVKLILVPVVFAIASTAYADSSKTYYFQSKDPKVHEQFYCSVQNAKPTDRVIGYNHAEMIKGFTANGIIETNVDTINKYAFDAYHDEKYPTTTGTANFKVDNKDAVIDCNPSTVGRPIIGGNYGQGLP
jgi:hypothetical protein